VASTLEYTLAFEKLAYNANSDVTNRAKLFKILFTGRVTATAIQATAAAA